MWAGVIFSLRQELMVTVILFVLLVMKIGAAEYRTSVVLGVVNFLLLANLVLGFMGGFGWWRGLIQRIFHTNRLIVLEKNMLNLGTLLISLQAYDWLKGHRQAPEFYILLLATLVGFFFMISAGNLLMFYLGLELSTIPLAALSSFDLEKRQSSEGAMKFILSAAFSSALLLLGCSFLYGATGTLDLGCSPGGSTEVRSSFLRLFLSCPVSRSRSPRFRSICGRLMFMKGARLQ